MPMPMPISDVKRFFAVSATDGVDRVHLFSECRACFSRLSLNTHFFRKKMPRWMRGDSPLGRQEN
jgi:hypothetical protein